MGHIPSSASYSQNRQVPEFIAMTMSRRALVISPRHFVKLVSDTSAARQRDHPAYHHARLSSIHSNISRSRRISGYGHGAEQAWNDFANRASLAMKPALYSRRLYYRSGRFRYFRARGLAAMPAPHHRWGWRMNAEKKSTGNIRLCAVCLSPSFLVGMRQGWSSWYWSGDERYA